MGIQEWSQLVEIARNVGLIAGGANGIYLAWLRVTASNEKAEAQVRQADASARQADLARRKLVGDLVNQAV